MAEHIITGYAVEKKNYENTLIRDILFVSGRIKVWATRPAVNNPGVYNAADVKEYELVRMKDTELLTKGKDILKLINDNAGIEPTYVTVLRKGSYVTNIGNYESVVTIPQTKIEDRAAANTLMNAKLDELIVFRKTTFASTAMNYMETHPLFYEAFKNSIKVDNNPTTKLALKGQAKDKVTGEGIAKMTVMIPSLNKQTKTGAKGNYLFKSLPAGQYTLVFSMYGYLTQQKVVYINAGVRVDVDVVMVPKSSLPTRLTIRTFNAVDQTLLGGVSLSQVNGVGVGVTNAQGVYVAFDAGPETLVLKATKAGFAPTENEFEVEEHEENVWDIYLLPEA